MMFLNRICTICLFIFLTCNADSKHRYKWQTKILGNYTYFPLNYSSHKRLVEPLSYEIFLNITFKNDSTTFRGDTTAWLIIEYPTIHINLNAHGLTIRNESISLYRFPYVDKYSLSDYFYLNETLILDFKTAILPGYYKLDISFSGNIYKNETGFYETGCKNCIGAPRWMFVTQIKPTVARRIFPCWDDPILRARFAINIAYQQYNNLLNIPSRWHRIMNHFQWTRFYSPSPIPIYLIAFLVKDFDCSTKEEDTFTTRVCTSSAKDQIIFALNTSAEVTAYFRRYMKISPQLSEITHIGLPDFSYEAEGNWGLNIYRENHLIYNETLHSIDRKLNVSMYVSSLVALQWLGNLVSPTSWTHMWFCQTLALFYGVKAFTKTYNNEGVTSLLTYRLQSLARENHVVSQVKPVIYPTDNRDEIDRLFKTSHFSNCLKEYAIIAMLENAVTESIFLDATITYLEKHQFSTATPNDFWDNLQYIIEKRKILSNVYKFIPQIVQSWLKIRSLPVLTVTLNYGDNYIDAVISPSSGITENDNIDKLWIPVNITKSNAIDIPKFQWLSSRIKRTQLRLYGISNLQSVIVNWQYTGYYRVKYDTLSLQALTRHLHSAESTQINVLNRAHIIEDAYYFWTEGELHIDVFLNLIHFISNEKTCAPWYAMQNIIQKMWPFLHMDVGIRLKHTILDILVQLLEKVGYTEHGSDTECVKFQRLTATKWACRLLHVPCLEVARLNLLAHSHIPEHKLMSPMWEELIYCNGLISSDDQIWFTVFKEFLKNGNKRILKHLVCSENMLIMRDYLEIAMLNNSIICQLFGLNFEDLQHIYRWIIKKHIRRNEVFDYALQKIVRMKNESQIIENLSYIINNVYSIDQIEKISLLKILFQKSRNDTILINVSLRLGPEIKHRRLQIQKLEQILSGKEKEKD